MMRPRQGVYKPPVHEYKSIWERDAALEKAYQEVKERERKWGWVGESFQWLVYLAFFAFLVTSCVQGDFTASGPKDCKFHYRGACDG